MNSTVCIIGSHPRTRLAFDFNRTDCDIWVFNEAISNKTLPRADAVFQIHPEPIWRNPENRNDPGHYDWLKTQTEIPVYMQEVYLDVPASKKYPLDNIRDMLGDSNHFLSSSVAEAVALALYFGIYKRIEVWGVAMETNTEYQFQREGVAFWYGFAKGRGVEFYFADPTFQCPVYGYDAMVALDYQTFQDRLTELAAPLKEITEKYTNEQESVKGLIREFADGNNNTDKMLSHIKNLITLGQKLGAIDGALQENEYYKGKADTMREAAQGEFIFSRQEFESRAAGTKDNVAGLRTNGAALGGQLDLLHRDILNAAKGSPKRNRLMKSYLDTMTAYLQTNNMIGLHTGAMNENFRYMGILDKGIRAAGGEKSEVVLLESMRQNATG